MLKNGIYHNHANNWDLKGDVQCELVSLLFAGTTLLTTKWL